MTSAVSGSLVSLGVLGAEVVTLLSILVNCFSDSSFTSIKRETKEVAMLVGATFAFSFSSVPDEAADGGGVDGAEVDEDEPLFVIFLSSNC